MKFAHFAFFAPLVLASCSSKQVSAPPTPVAVPKFLPTIEFVSQPTLQNDVVKAKLQVRIPKNQYSITITSLQGLTTQWQPYSRPRQEYIIEDVGVPEQTELPRFSPTDKSLLLAGENSFVVPLKSLRFDRDGTRAFRIKIVLMHAGNAPQYWRNPKSVVLFSDWMPYKNRKTLL